MAATIDVVTPKMSHAGRALLRHANLRLRHARLEQAIRAMKARDAPAETAGFQRELDAVREELRRLGQWQAGLCSTGGAHADLGAAAAPVDRVGSRRVAAVPGDLRRTRPAA